MGQTSATPPPRARSGRRVLLVVLGVLVVAVTVIAIPTLTWRRTAPHLPDYGMVPAFAFTDELGRPYQPTAMVGHATVVNFIFTRCDTVCPASSMRMLDVQQRTEDLDQAVQLVSFSVDPDHDTPPVLAAYAREFHQDPRRWRFVTGPLDKTKALVEGAFMTGIDDRGTTPQGSRNILHGGKFLLVDRDLHIRGAYDTDPADLDRLIRHARYLARGGR